MFLKIVGIFAIICWDLLSNSDDEGRVGIKRLITRNQFVDNTTRGFESLPLRQKHSNPIWGCCVFLLAHRKWILTMRRMSQGSHLSVAIGELAHQWRSDKSSPLVNTPPEEHIRCCCVFLLAHRKWILTMRRMSQGTAMCRSDTTHYAGYGIRIAVCYISHKAVRSSLI